MLIEHDPVRAFMPYPPVAVETAPDGPLAGLSFAVKDLFDVSGYRTGCGCPLRLAMSDVKSDTAPSIRMLLDAGASFKGKTHTDELAWSLYGLNPHFGTPINPAAPDRIPGGSSSGSASAVAAGLVDFAIGTDTGGSVRAPASFCGLWALRPTHARISLAGCMELAGSFDTYGVFARDSETLSRVLGVVCAEDPVPLPEDVRLLRPTDMAARLAPEQKGVYDAVFGGLAAEEVSVYPAGGVEPLYDAFRILQGADARRAVVPFIMSSGMPLTAGIDERSAAAQRLTDDEEAKGNAVRTAFRAGMDDLLGSDGVLLVPAVHDAPFRLDAGRDVFDSFRHDAMRLLCVAGMSGLPQVVFPAGTVDGAPYGLSMIGPRGSDLSLVRLAGRLFGAIARPSAKIVALKPA
ncbi:amidase [Jiella mangrovi]|uniref:Amidase n=1 Tax=Jiella mangrovi TaxID=2821407 RepID=A0ABS4BDH3_9HYPH|nr:amidase [Jiella mangrovi]MBP0614587.1 amidase [Jiella mangrovi]